MPEFVCTVCSAVFKVPDEVMAKYPNWVPKYCRAHSPRRASKQRTAPARPPRPLSAASEEDIPLEEVLARYTEGPDSGIFTDGSARPNPGPGGWGLVRVQRGQVLQQLYGASPKTTNNRMELTALIEAFKLIEPEEQEAVFSDSELCVNTLTKWAPGWEQRGWKRKTGPIENLELVQEAYYLYRERPGITLSWIKAHNGWRWNEYANALATAWARERL